MKGKPLLYSTLDVLIVAMSAALLLALVGIALYACWSELRRRVDYVPARIQALLIERKWYQFGPFEAYLAQERYRDVIDLATANLDMVGNQEESHTYLGRARQALGDVEAARRCYREALRYHPGFVPATEALESLD
jgi:tetratricopeptide (TPR) repeat protein